MKPKPTGRELDVWGKRRIAMIRGIDRFSYKILPDKLIKITVEDWLPEYSLSFTITSKEVITLKRLLNDAGFEWSNQFSCSLDEPECK